MAQPHVPDETHMAVKVYAAVKHLSVPDAYVTLIHVAIAHEDPLLAERIRELSCKK